MVVESSRFCAFLVPLYFLTSSDTPEKGKITPEYRELHNRIKNLCYHIDRKNGVERESMIAECKTLRKQLLKTPCTAQTDKKLKYIRYADDFIIGVKGSKEDCQWIKSKLSEFIGQTLKMELSEEKTLITHSSECARFLGFDVRVRRCEKVKRNKKGTKARTLNNHVELLVPFDDKIHNFIFSKGIAIQKKDGKLFPVHRNSPVPSLYIATTFEILLLCFAASVFRQLYSIR